MRLDAIAKVPTDQLPSLFEQDFNNLVTAAIADAVRLLPPAARDLLRSAEWWQDWSDALLCAEGGLQIAAERMAYAGDPRCGSTEVKLRKVRTRLAEARTLAGQHRRGEHEAASATQSLTDTRATALLWLTRVFPEDHQVLRGEVLHEQGLPAAPKFRPPARDVFDSLEEARDLGWIVAEMTPPSAALLGLGDVAFRNVVADDARHQNDRNIPLRHPMVLRRWDAALDDLAERTYGPARTLSSRNLGPLKDDLHALDEEAAAKILNARRFFSAVQQRKVECGSVVRQLMRAAERRKAADPQVVALFEAEAEVRRRLAQAHPVEYEHILARLRPWEAAPGVIDTVRLTTNLRGELKALTVQELRAVAGLAL